MDKTFNPDRKMTPFEVNDICDDISAANRKAVSIYGMLSVYFHDGPEVTDASVAETCYRVAHMYCRIADRIENISRERVVKPPQLPQTGA